MTVLKSYTCSNCAGILIFDSNQEFFDCPFCGTNFTSLDFHENEVLGQADACLDRKEFNSAKEKYRAILAEDPRSFNALRGILLSTIMISSEKELEDSRKLRTANLDRIRSELDNVKNFSGKLNRQYFNTISNMTDYTEELLKIEKVRDEMESETSKKLSSDIDKSLKNSSGKFFDARMIRITVFLALLIILHIVFIFLTDFDLSVILYTLAKLTLYIGPFILLGVAVNISNTKSHKKLKELGENFELKKVEVASRIKKLENAYSDEYTKLISLKPETEETDTEEPEKTPYNTDLNIILEKTIQCAKCGDTLSLDSGKRVYECGSCGVAYGISLFFGLPHEKALNSMNMGFFAEADKRFSHILMADPSDFEALLGRILCAGRWTKASDICISDDLTPTRVKHARNGLSEALTNAKESDRPYFECLEEFIDALNELAINKHKQRVIGKEMDVIQAKIDVYSDFVDMNEVTRVDREYIMSRLKPYRDSEFGLKLKYDEARSKIIAMARDSVLTK